ncbi:hypothetical protein [Moraxella lacunata]|uniref:hypothetical protein n=1 Tax=Moraxella lacunata TaxID=477 RepID=UPI003EE2F4EB
MSNQVACRTKRLILSEPRFWGLLTDEIKHARPIYQSCQCSICSIALSTRMGCRPIGSQNFCQITAYRWLVGGSW